MVRYISIEHSKILSVHRNRNIHTRSFELAPVRMLHEYISNEISRERNMASLRKENGQEEAFDDWRKIGERYSSNARALNYLLLRNNDNLQREITNVKDIRERIVIGQDSMVQRLDFQKT